MTRSGSRFIALVAGAGMFSLISLACSRHDRGGGQGAELTQISLRLPIPVVDAAFAPYFLAQDAGIFKRHGLEVKIEPGSPELNPVRMVDSGTNQFGVVGGPELVMSGRAAGGKIKGIALLHKDANFPVIVTLKKSNMTRPQDLNGKKIGFFFGHISTDVLRAFLQEQHITYESVDVGFNYGPLISGQLDAEWAFRTTGVLTLTGQGVNLNVIDPSAYGVVTQGHVIITSEKLIHDRPALVASFVDSIREACARGIAKPEDFIQATAKRAPALPAKLLSEQVRIYNAAISRNSKFGVMDPAVLAGDARRQQAAGILSKDLDVQAGFTNEFVGK
jgi:NitT/TauT family transport system substrate-binding protein